MKSFVKNERNQNYLEHVLHHLVNIHGFLHNGQNAMLFVVMELSQELLFVVNLMEMLLRKLMNQTVMLNRNLKLNVNVKDLQNVLLNGFRDHGLIVLNLVEMVSETVRFFALPIILWLNFQNVLKTKLFTEMKSAMLNHVLKMNFFLLTQQVNQQKKTMKEKIIVMKMKI